MMIWTSSGPDSAPPTPPPDPQGVHASRAFKTTTQKTVLGPPRPCVASEDDGA